MNTAIQQNFFGTPGWGLFGVEPMRAAFEYASMHFMDKSALPRGDGHPVVIFPGLAGDSRSVGPLRVLCEQLGYAAYDWGRGLNAGPQGDVNAWLDDLAEHVGDLAATHDQRMSLVGWSLGGIYAREVAKKLPRRVRQVITIGSPFAGTAGHNNATWLYRLVNGVTPLVDQSLLDRLRSAPDVPTTSIFSRTDGVVAWQTCVQDGTREDTENIEVFGSHCGLGWNPEVLSIIADRLRQPSKGWQRYRVNEL
jgi:pimeloyl-ACP methyl ester carboxylesterase